MNFLMYLYFSVVCQLIYDLLKIIAVIKIDQKLAVPVSFSLNRNFGMKCLLQPLLDLLIDDRYTGIFFLLLSLCDFDFRLL